MFLFLCSCFIRDNRIRYGIFLVPLFSIIVFNVIIFVMVARVLIRHSRRTASKLKDTKGKTVNTVKLLISIVCVMVMFGLSWLFGALSVDKAATVFQWFFAISTTSQGFLLFILLCVVNNDAREEWKKLLTCYRYQGKKKGSALLSSTAKQSRNYVSRETNVRRGESGGATKSSTWQNQKRGRGNLNSDSSLANLEMDEFTTDTTKDLTTITEDDTQNLIISNDHAKPAGSNQIERPDSQVPPQILFRLKRRYYDLVMEQADGSASPEWNTQTGIDIDGYRERNSDYEQSDTDSDLDYTAL